MEENIVFLKQKKIFYQFKLIQVRPLISLIP